MFLPIVATRSFTSMSTLIRYVSVAALVARALAQNQGGFPDCQNGPLSNTTVCDTSAGE